MEKPIRVAGGAPEVVSGRSAEGASLAVEGGVPVTGNVTLDTEFEALHEGLDRLDGAMTLNATGAGVEHSLHVRVENLAWKATLLPDRNYSVSDLHLRGFVAALVDPSDTVSRLETAVFARIGNGAVLRVVDLATGEDLDSVHVHMLKGFSDWLRVSPNSNSLGAPLAKSARSPLSLPAGFESYAYWIGAEGYNWGRISVGVGQKRATCYLERAGSLALEIPVDTQGRPVEFHVMLQRHSGSGNVELVSQRRLEKYAQGANWDGLVPGLYSLFLGRLVGPDVPPAWGLLPSRDSIEWMAPRSVEVRARERSVLRVPGPFPWVTPGGMLKGTVHIPPELDSKLDSRYSISAVRLVGDGEEPAMPVVLQARDCKKVSDGVSWHLRWVLPGDYLVKLRPHGLTEVVTVPDGEVGVSFLDLGDCFSVAYRVRGASKFEGAPVTVAWRPESAADDGTSWGSVKSALGSAGSFLTAGGGPFALRLWSPAHEVQLGAIQLGAGAAEHVFTLQERDPHRVLVHLTCEGDEVLAPIEFFEGVQVVDSAGNSMSKIYEPADPHAGSTHGFNLEYSAAFLVLSRGGQCEFNIPGIRGYQALGPIAVEVLDSGVTRVELELKSLWPARR